MAKEPVNAEFIEDILCQKSYDIILPTCSSSPYASNYEHYKNKHVIKDFDTTRDVILQKYPDYVKAFDLMSHTNLASLDSLYDDTDAFFDITFMLDMDQTFLESIKKGCCPTL